MNSLLTSLPTFLPLIYEWAEKQERIILDIGTPLSAAQMGDAHRAGVTYPENIRLRKVETLPEPDNDELIFMAKQVGLFSSRSRALTLGYGICLREDSLENRAALVHELVHVAQHEKLTGLRPFLASYLRECIDPGFPFGSLEQQAIVLTREICKQAPLSAVES